MVKIIPKWQKIGSIPGMLLFGTACVVVQKFILDQKGTGDPKYEVHYFSKPWFMTVVMFVGMGLSLPFYFISLYIKKRKQNSERIGWDEKEHSEDNPNLTAEEEQQEQPNNRITFKLVISLAALAMCDLLSTSILNIGLLSITASAWQMLRGSMVLFSTIFSTIFLKRKIYGYMWFSVVIVVISLVIVGVSSVISSGISNPGVSQGQVIFAICLTIGSQVIAAAKIVVEDFMLHDQDVNPIFLVGLQGVWGTFFSFAIFFPLTQYAFLKFPEGGGLNEDWYDTFKMFSKSPLLIVLLLVYTLLILGYNVMGMFVIHITSGVVRSILEGIRTLCIWVVQVIIYYSISKIEYGWHHPNIGESLELYSLMEFGGFLLLFTAMLTYNQILKLPCFKYEESTT